MHEKHHRLMRLLMLPLVRMRTTLVLDDELLDEAQRLTGITEKTALVREAMRALVERESSRRLAALGGSDPDAKAPPRRRRS